jgi:hypothetical protein
MKMISHGLMGLVLILSLAGCQVGIETTMLPPSPAVPPADIRTPTTAVTTSPSLTPVSPTPSVVAGVSKELAEASTVVGYSVRQPAFLPQGYVLDRTTVDAATHSVCLQYRFPAAPENLLFIAQGPSAQAPAPALVPGWPDYAILHEETKIGGAEKAFKVSGWRRSGWACTQAAETEKTSFSFALAPRLSWEFDQKQFEIYSASAGCGNPGGVTEMDILRMAESLTGAPSLAADALDPECLHSAAEAEKLAGFKVKMPDYFPENVAFYYATYEKAPANVVTLFFYHKEHANMGSFFQINQGKDAPVFFVKSCAEVTENACEALKLGTTPLIYQRFERTEQLDWSVDGYYYSLLRNAGSPGMVYKDEMLKVAGSLK